MVASANSKRIYESFQQTAALVYQNFMGSAALVAHHLHLAIDQENEAYPWPAGDPRYGRAAALCDAVHDPSFEERLKSNASNLEAFLLGLAQDSELGEEEETFSPPRSPAPMDVSPPSPPIAASSPVHQAASPSTATPPHKRFRSGTVTSFAALASMGSEMPSASQPIASSSRVTLETLPPVEIPQSISHSTSQAEVSASSISSFGISTLTLPEPQQSQKFRDARRRLSQKRKRDGDHK